MICGVCGGGVRGFRGIRHGRPIADWKHTSVPPGTQPHRPVLGRPVDIETLDRIHRPERDEGQAAEKVQPRVVAVQPATEEQVTDSQSVVKILKLLEEERWDQIGQIEYRQRDDGVEYLVLKARRRDLGAVALWRFNEKKGAWEFDDGWALSPRGRRRVQSTSLKEWLKTRDETCPDCGRSSIMHGEECT